VVTDVRAWSRSWLERHPFLARLVAFILFPLALIFFGLYVLLLRGLPVTRGVVDLMGVRGPVTIARDARGVPHIRAESDRDAFFALGFVHAQDRMWQMEYKRRLGKGTLSEILGVGALSSDELMRTLGLYRASVNAFASMPKAEREVLRAYADGVNAWIDGGFSLPIEFHYYGVQPEHWTETDSLLMIKLLALGLCANYKSELSSEMLRKHLGEAAARELTGEDSRRNGSAAESAVGSNAWAVSGAHTVSGFPMLASDPHLQQQLPSTFYLAQIRGSRLHVSGGTIPGLPLVIFGHNDVIAWGGTNLAADVQDLYAEHVAIDKEEYEVDGHWWPFERHEEWIKVAREFPAFLREAYPPVRWIVRSTRHGPLISDAIGHTEQPLSLRWTSLDSSDSSFNSLLAVNYAGNLSEFEAALRQYVAPALSFVYADRLGNIALIAAGKIPVRKTGQGRVPAPGWNDDYEWTGYLEPQELPRIVNPDSGVVVSANQRILPDDDARLISNSWQPPYRANRIETVLRKMMSDRKLDTSDFATLQNDVLEPEAHELLPFLTRLTGLTALQREALGRLRVWDGRMSEHSVGASIYEAWSRHFMERLVADKLRADLVEAGRFAQLQQQVSSFRPEFLRRVALGELRHWCGSAPNSCGELALSALDEATDELRMLAGSSPDGWEWGNVHHTRLRHTPFTAHPLLRLVFDRESPSSGGRYTVNVAGDEFLKDRGYIKVLGAAYRQIIPLQNVADSRFMIDGGQSGNVLDSHYSDLMALYRAGAYLQMRDPPERDAVATLALRPRVPE
jgi:penicillin amidase